ncbi:hypothetical protein RP20_CCG014187 [Aedes albopictus]|uniref:Uncharacterized protein n=1 Tax=Aedes albopictus TaxID=7160 RepID=A0A023EHZ8_AEDAL|nr:hypothetical protein RP20_CCG014187 [Aedes albopictus]
MDVNAYRRIGSVYVVVCCIVAACGASICLYQLMEAKPACRDFSCPDGTKNIIILAVTLKICILCAMFAGLLKDGIEERKICAVRVNRVFVVVRTLSLIALWTCWAVFRSDDDRYVGGLTSSEKLVLASMCVGLLAITIVELTIFHGVLKYLKEGTPPCSKKGVPEVVYIQA